MKKIILPLVLLVSVVLFSSFQSKQTNQSMKPNTHHCCGKHVKLHLYEELLKLDELSRAKVIDNINYNMIKNAIIAQLKVRN